MSSLKVLSHPMFGEVRAVIQKDNYCFVLNDVCRAMELRNPRATKGYIDNEELTKVSVHTPGGKQELNAIGIFGVYQLATLSRRPNAKMVRKWLYEVHRKVGVEDRMFIALGRILELADTHRYSRCTKQDHTEVVNVVLGHKKDDRIMKAMQLAAIEKVIRGIDPYSENWMVKAVEILSK